MKGKDADERKRDERVEIFFLKPSGKRSFSEVQTFVRSEQDIIFAARLQE
jgi:hypothetical protein